MEIKWHMIALIAMQFIALLFGLLGHGNYVGKTGKAHAGLWKSCLDDNCVDLDMDRFSNQHKHEIRSSRAFLIISHFATVAVLLELTLVMFGLLGGVRRVVVHLVTCSIQAFTMGLAISIMTDIPLGAKMGWSLAIPWVGFVLASLVLPAGCTQIDENGKEIKHEEMVD